MWYPPRRPSCLLTAFVSVPRAMWVGVVVQPLVPSGGSPLVPTCLLDVCRRASTLRPVISSIVLGYVRSSACLVSCLFPLRLASSSRRSCRPMASRLPPRLIDTTGGASSSVIVRCSWLLVRLSSRPVLLASCLSCGLSSGASAVPACYPFLPFSSIVVSFGFLLVRQVGWGGGGLRLGLGSPRSLLPVACRGGAVDVAGRFLLCVLLFCRRVDGIGWLRDFRHHRCLLWVLLSGWLLLACHRRHSGSAARGVFAIVCGLALCRPCCLLRPRRRGSLWADCHRVLSSWFRLVVGRRVSPSRLACPRGCHQPCLPRGAFAVDRFVDRFAASRPVLLAVRRDGLAGRVLSRPVRIVAWCFALLSPLSLVMAWRLVLSVCLLAVSVSCGGGRCR